MPKTRATAERMRAVQARADMHARAAMLVMSQGSQDEMSAELSRSFVLGYAAALEDFTKEGRFR